MGVKVIITKVRGLSRLEHLPVPQKVAGSIPGQDPYLGCGFVSQLGHHGRQPINLSLSHSVCFPPSPTPMVQRWEGRVASGSRSCTVARSCHGPHSPEQSCLRRRRRLGRSGPLLPWTKAGSTGTHSVQGCGPQGPGHSPRERCPGYS